MLRGLANYKRSIFGATIAGSSRRAHFRCRLVAGSFSRYHLKDCLKYERRDVKASPEFDARQRGDSQSIEFRRRVLVCKARKNHMPFHSNRQFWHFRIPKADDLRSPTSPIFSPLIPHDYPHLGVRRLESMLVNKRKQDWLIGLCASCLSILPIGLWPRSWLHVTCLFNLITFPVRQTGVIWVD